MKFTSPERKAWECTVLVAIFTVVFVFLLFSFTMEQRTCREKQLMGELKELRSGLQLYTTIEHKRPDNLVELCTAKFRIPGDRQNNAYVSRGAVRLNEQGEIVDPFGNPFAYDKGKLWVTSTTPGFQNW